MYYAWHEKADLIRPNPNSRALCPSCKKTVIAKCGDKMSWHWAHEVDGNCEKRNKGIWHARMQSMFDIKYCEVPFSYDGESRRADVANDKHVIEFQDSYITQEEVTARDEFYEKVGRKVIWVMKAKGIINQNKFMLGYPPRLFGDRPDVLFFRWDSPPMSKLLKTNNLVLWIEDQTMVRIDHWQVGYVSKVWQSEEYEGLSRDYESRFIYGTAKPMTIDSIIGVIS